MNAFKAGIFAATSRAVTNVPALAESQEEVDRFLAERIAALDPRDVIERDAAGEAAQTQLLLRRAGIFMTVALRGAAWSTATQGVVVVQEVERRQQLVLQALGFVVQLAAAAGEDLRDVNNSLIPEALAAYADVTEWDIGEVIEGFKLCRPNLPLSTIPSKRTLAQWTTAIDQALADCWPDLASAFCAIQDELESTGTYMASAQAKLAADVASGQIEATESIERRRAHLIRMLNTQLDNYTKLRKSRDSS